MRIKPNDIPALRDKIASEQGNQCWLCEISLDSVVACLDHDHQTGLIRGVLCNNCNGIEGKIFNLARRAKRDKTPTDVLIAILTYWDSFAKENKGLIHPSHRTPEEKRVKRNRQARLRRKNKLK